MKITHWTKCKHLTVDVYFYFTVLSARMFYMHVLAALTLLFIEIKCKTMRLYFHIFFILYIPDLAH